jgi:transcriptional regulator with XRE-family HTH domain
MVGLGLFAPLRRGLALGAAATSGRNRYAAILNSKLASALGVLMGSPSENVRLARARAGLEPADVALAVGLNEPSYYDLEAHDGEEVTGNISLGMLSAIARTLRTTTVELLEGHGAVGPASRRSPSVLAELARARVAADGVTVDAYGDHIGWDVVPVLANPEHVWEYPFAMLHALCEDLGVDWKEFIDAPTSPG